ncbi:ATP-binding protein [Pandoraea sp. NPDC087047]|uniref:hybrid sensor histidine kinase/response regulator n=1 Tax=Pandoraea sp. NPDC087047 TaxID=3364390 RepID=UPI00382F473E
MSDQQAGTYLRRFMHFQRALIYGGGALVTLAILAALTFHAVSIAERYAVREHQDLTVDLRRIADETTQAESLLRSYAVNGELLFQRDAMATHADVDRFFKDGRVFSLPEYPTLLVIGIDRRPISRDEVARTIAFALHMAPLLDVVARRRGAPMSAYALSADRSLAVLSLSAPPTRAEFDRLVANRQSLGKRLADRLPSATDWDDTGPQAVPNRRPVRWLEPTQDPLSGASVIRLATVINDPKGAPLFDVVVDIPTELIGAALPKERFPGAFAVVAAGNVITSTATHALSRQALEHALRAHPSEAPERGAALWSHGGLMFQERYGTTRWSLVYVVPWQTILGDLDTPVSTTLGILLGIIAMIWALLLAFDYRVFRPTLARSIRVSESEHLSRMLIGTAPVGLSLIDTHTAKPLLRSPTMTELEARISPLTDGIATTLVQCYERAGHPSTPTQTSAQADIVTDVLTFERAGATPLKVALRLAPARYQNRDVIVATLSDITAEHELQVKTAEARRAAEAANAAKSAFLAATSHEIRTPLHAILGNLELLARSDLEATQRDRLSTVQAAGRQLTRIIDDILDLSKIEAGDMQYESIAFDLVALAEQAMTLFLPNAQAKSITLLHTFNTTTPRWWMGDPTRIAQVLRNLLSNAVKFTSHSQILMTLDIAPGDHPTSPSFIELVVEDTGIGIDPAHQAVIFDAFRQVDETVTRRFGGTGLGLSLCKRLVAGMGGTISVESTLGVGSRFRVRIPASVAPQASCDSRAGSLDASAVVLAASHAEWTDHATRLLTHWGMSVKTSGHPADIDTDAIGECDVVVLWGDRNAWTSVDEDRLLETAPQVVIVTPDGPRRPIRTGRLTSISCYSVDGLYAALGGIDAPCTDDSPALSNDDRVALGLSVLVVEDNPANRQLMAEQLHTLGCQVHTVDTGEAALDQLTQLAGRADHVFDVLITDLNMPGMTGLELAQTLQSRGISLPILLISAGVAPDVTARAKAAGIERTLVKPVNLRELLEALQDYVPAPRSALAATEFVSSDSLKEVFVTSVAQDLSRLRQAHAVGDIDGLHAALHSLKGCLGVFGFEALAIQVRHLEQQLDDASEGDPLPSLLQWADQVEHQIVTTDSG